MLRAAAADQRSGNAIPVIQYAASASATEAQLVAAWQGGGGAEGASLDGMAVPLSALQSVAAAAWPGETGLRGASAAEAADAVLRRLSGRPSKRAEDDAAAAAAAKLTSSSDASGSFAASSADSRSWIGRLATSDRESLLAEEKRTLQGILGFLEEVRWGGHWQGLTHPRSQGGGVCYLPRADVENDAVCLSSFR